jgi:hypothetical protein
VRTKTGGRDCGVVPRTYSGARGKKTEVSCGSAGGHRAWEGSGSEY